MPRLYAAALLLLLGALVPVQRACALTLGLSATGGLMQQPTSHYYHAIYGAEALFGTTSEGLLLRANYLERPEFHDAGYADKDWGWFGMIGTKVTKTPNRGLYAFIGLGRMSGYVKADADFRGDSGEASNHYIVTGLTTALAYMVHLGPLLVGAEHQIFIGYVDKRQLDALVGWPYTYFQLKVGYTW